MLSLKRTGARKARGTAHQRPLPMSLATSSLATRATAPSSQVSGLVTALRGGRWLQGTHPPLEGPRLRPVLLPAGLLPFRSGEHCPRRSAAQGTASVPSTLLLRRALRMWSGTQPSTDRRPEGQPPSLPEPRGPRAHGQPCPRSTAAAPQVPALPRLGGHGLVMGESQAHGTGTTSHVPSQPEGPR